MIMSNTATVTLAILITTMGVAHPGYIRLGRRRPPHNIGHSHSWYICAVQRAHARLPFEVGLTDLDDAVIEIVNCGIQRAYYLRCDRKRKPYHSKDSPCDSFFIK